MRITDLDPLQHGLIFERFLNPERVSMPDFDVDFDDRRRGEVIQLRHREVRRRARRPDRHLRHDQGQAGASRTPPGCWATRSHGREAHQGDAAGRHGQGHAAVGHLRQRATRATARRGEFRQLHRDGPEAKKVFETALGPRGPEAAVGRARRRRDHVQRAADRHHPDHAPRAGRPDHHAVRLPELRDARPDQDGLPRPAQPHDHRRRAREHRRRTAASDIDLDALSGPRRPGRATSCSPAATRSACSSSTAAACARCCG